MGPGIGGGNGSEAEMHERYSFDSGDHALLTAAVVLLKKVAAAAMLRPAEMVSVAKLQAESGRPTEMKSASRFPHWFTNGSLGNC
jgi:hypothetical protein